MICAAVGEGYVVHQGYRCRAILTNSATESCLHSVGLVVEDNRLRVTIAIYICKYFGIRSISRDTERDSANGIGKVPGPVHRNTISISVCNSCSSRHLIRGRYEYSSERRRNLYCGR